MKQAPSHHKPQARSVFIAFLLSIFTSGLGQMYNGQLIKGIAFFVILLALPTLSLLLGIVHSFYGLVLTFLVIWCWYFYIIIDACISASKQKNFIPKSYNKWHYLLLGAVFMFFAWSLYDTRYFTQTKIFHSGSPANAPALEVGDYIVTDFGSYTNNLPAYGDLVVFQHAKNDIRIFRVVGLPHDKINFEKQKLTINGKPCATSLIKETKLEDEAVEEYTEKLPNGYTHNIYIYQISPNEDMSNLKDIVVPADHYYLVGDNRDNAQDSRYLGYIHKKQIKGKVLYRFWSKIFQNVGTKF